MLVLMSSMLMSHTALHLFVLSFVLACACDYVAGKNQSSLSNVALKLDRSEIICNIMQHHTTLCNTIQHYATPYNIMQHHTTLCNTIQHYATPYNIMQHFSTLCNKMVKPSQPINTTKLLDIVATV